MPSKVVVRKYWRYIVVSLALLVGVTILSQKVFASNSRTLLDPLNVSVMPVTHSNGGFPNGLMHAIGGETLSGSDARCPGFTSGPGACDHTRQSVEGAITDTPTSTSTPTASVTPSPAMLVGHLIWELIPQPSSRSVQPVSLTLTMGGAQIDYPTQNTDERGFFTVSVEGLASGTYNYRVKGPKYLAKAGTVTLTGAPITQLEIGTMIGSDANNDNVSDGIDFSIVRVNFNRVCGSDPLCARADFNNDGYVDFWDYHMTKHNFGLLGAPPDSAVPPSTGDAFLSLQPGSAGNCSAPANGGTVEVGCRFVLDMMVNMGSVPDGVAMQSYLTFTHSILQNARVSLIDSSCVPTNSTTTDQTIFDANMENYACNGPAPCTFSGGTVDAGSIARAQGALHNCETGCGGTFRVAQIGLCVVAPGQAVLHWQFSPPAPRNRHSAIVDVNGNMVQDQSLFTDYVINPITPTFTRTFTRTPTNTPTVTPTPNPRLVGHVTIEGRPAQPNPLHSVPVTLTLKVSGGGPENHYSTSTDASGFFTITSPGPGLYDWRVKNPQTLATSGSVTLPSSGTTQQEMGLLRQGDANNDNCTNITDFNIVKASFGATIGNPNYDERADFTGDQSVNISDFNLLKINFGQCGVGPIRPAP